MVFWDDPDEDKILIRGTNIDQSQEFVEHVCFPRVENPTLGCDPTAFARVVQGIGLDCPRDLT